MSPDSSAPTTDAVGDAPVASDGAAGDASASAPSFFRTAPPRHEAAPSTLVDPTLVNPPGVPDPYVAAPDDAADATPPTSRTVPAPVPVGPPRSSGLIDPTLVTPGTEPAPTEPAPTEPVAASDEDPWYSRAPQIAPWTGPTSLTAGLDPETGEVAPRRSDGSPPSSAPSSSALPLLGLAATDVMAGGGSGGDPTPGSLFRPQAGTDPSLGSPGAGAPASDAAAWFDAIDPAAPAAPGAPADLASAIPPAPDHFDADALMPSWATDSAASTPSSPPPTVMLPPIGSTTLPPVGVTSEAARRADQEGRVWVPPGARPATDADDRRRPPRAALIGAVVVAVLLVATIGFVLTRGDDSAPEAASAPPAAETTTTTEAVALSGEVDLGDGIVATVPPGALTPGAELDAELIDAPDTVGSLVTPAGAVASIIVVGGEQLAPIEMTFPYEAIEGPVAPDAVAPGLVFALEMDGDRTTPIPGQLDAAAGTFTFEVDDAARLGVFTWADPSFTDSLRAMLTSRASDPAEGVTAPECANDARSEVTVTNPDGSLLWCAERGTDGSRTVRLTNSARHAVSVRWEGEPTATREGGSPLSDVVALRATESDPATTVLGPGERLTVVVAPGTEATISSSVSGLANVLTSTLVAAEAVAFTTGRIEWLPRLEIDDVVADVVASGCLDQVDPTIAADAAAWAAVADTCFSAERLAELGGEEAAPLLAGLISGLGNGPLFAATYENHLQTVSDAATGTFTVTDLNRWPVQDQDGGPLYIAWLAQNGFAAQWRSCSATHCIAGDGTDVRVTTMQPLADVFQVPQDPANPREALLGTGLTPEVVDVLLRPGPPPG